LFWRLRAGKTQCRCHGICGEVHGVDQRECGALERLAAAVGFFWVPVQPAV